MSAVDLALELVQLETVNPPGNEEIAADLLGSRLAAAGFELVRHELAPGRPTRPPPHHIQVAGLAPSHAAGMR